jgi:hypothetical protein
MFNTLQFPEPIARPARAYAAEQAQAEADLMLRAFQSKPLPTLDDHRKVLAAQRKARSLRRSLQ